MNIVIDIDDEIYKSVFHTDTIPVGYVDSVTRSIICGKTLEEQTDVLDKIRAEIEQLRLHKAEFLTNDNKVCIDSQAVLNIIDKYKQESEEEE